MVVAFMSVTPCRAASDDDTYTRHNPNMDDARGTLGSQTRAAIGDGTAFAFINRQANVIQMNGRSWEALAQKFANAGHDGVVSVVHIGDSHVQAEGNTSQIRKQLQAAYGDAGRGLIIPFRLAGTNQPLDYTFTSSSSHTTAKLLKKPWAVPVGFTGIALSSPTCPYTLSLTNQSPFDSMVIHASGPVGVTKITDPTGNTLKFKVITSNPKATVIELDTEVTACNVTLSSAGVNVYGIELINGHHGVRYSAIGNNGATFGTYNGVSGMADGVAALHPDLIIVALGTNEAFGTMSDAAFYAEIKRFINDIRRTNPHAELLLMTPSECERSVYNTVRTGSKNKRRARRVRSFAVNTNVARMAEVIRRFGRENHIPVYDFYTVAGGDGASAHWLSNKLLSNDRIHRTWAGYRLEGQLLTQALLKALDNPTAALDVRAMSPAETGAVAAMTTAKPPQASASEKKSTEKVTKPKARASKSKSKAKAKSKAKSKTKSKKKKKTSRRRR